MAGVLCIQVSQLTESIDTTRASHLDHADEALNNVRSEILANLAEDLKNNGSEEVGGSALSSHRDGGDILIGTNSMLVLDRPSRRRFAKASC